MSWGYHALAFWRSATIRSPMVAMSTTAAAIAAAHTMLGASNCPLVRATAIHTSPQLIASAGAIRPRVYTPRPIPIAVTNPITVTMTHRHPGNVSSPVVATRAGYVSRMAVGHRYSDRV